jgi:hypothetical protein
MVLSRQRKNIKPGPIAAQYIDKNTFGVSLRRKDSTSDMQTRFIVAVQMFHRLHL